MTAEALTSLPLSIGGAVAGATARGGMRALSAYMRAPLRNTGVVVLVATSVLAGSNALYRQAHHHPAPMFGSFSDAGEAQAPEPVLPAERPGTLEKVTKPAAAAKPAAASTPATTPIGNADVFDIQRKLQAFKLFDGKVDGLYGPQTAGAIRAFEQRIGRTPKGELTREIVELIRATPIIAAPSSAPAETTVTPEKVAAEPVQASPSVTPAAASVEPASLPDTAALPLVATAAQEASLPAPSPLVAIDAATSGAGDSGSGQAVALTTASTSPVATRTVQTIAVRAQAAAEPSQEIPPELVANVDAQSAATDPRVVSAVQRGLTSLGFLHGEVDGVAGEATAKAIRNFEVYFNYNVTGRITPDLVKLLVQNGAVI